MENKVPSEILAFAGTPKSANSTESVTENKCIEEVDFQSIKITGKTDKPPFSYAKDEKMVFCFKLDYGTNKPGKWFLSYERKGDDGKTFRGKVPFDRQLVVTTSLDRPGFVGVDVYLDDAEGQHLTRLNDSNVSIPIGFYAGAGVQTDTLRDCGEPEDFDEFWKNQKKRLAQVPFNGLVEKKLTAENESGSIYAVSIPAPGPRPVTGYMTLPRGAAPGSLPIMITFNGYGMRPQLPPESVNPGYIFLHINAHGQELNRDEAYYEEFFKSICTGDNSYAYDPELNKDPEKCYFNGMVMRVLRALEYLKTLPEWDGKNITASGSSQGGLQTMWAAALDQDVTTATPAVPWCCDLAGMAKVQRAPRLYPIKYEPALDYYDPVFMAKRITRAEVIITRGGLGDYSCPPSGVAVCYNNLATPRKTIHWYQGSSHGFIPQEPEIITWTTEK